MGGLIIVVDVKIKFVFIYVVFKFVVMIFNCVVMCYVYFYLDGSGLVDFKVLKLEEWLEVIWEVGENICCVNMDEVIKEDIKEWKVGEIVLLLGKMLIGCDVVYKCI